MTWLTLLAVFLLTSVCAGQSTGFIVAKTFIKALESRDLALLDQLFTVDVTMTQAMIVTPPGHQSFANATAFFGRIFANFERIAIPEAAIHDSVDMEGNRSVWVESDAHFIIAGSGQHYHNVYLFRLDYATPAGQPKIHNIREFFNSIKVGCAFYPQLAHACADLGWNVTR